jgi:hypothetical protein
MKTLISLIHESNDAEDLRDLHDTYLEIETILETYRSVLTESEDTDNLFDETARMLAAAKRGLGIANKLRTPEDRAKNRSRIMGTMNRLRAQLRRIEKAIEATDPEPVV